MGHSSAKGHPSGGPWRPRYCSRCRGSFLETHGTLLHGQRGSVDLIVPGSGCWAEGLGIRGPARGFAVDPNTVLQWLVAAAELLRAFSPHVLHDVRVRQVQLDARCALLGAVKAGEGSEAEALERLERSPQWVWGAMAPERTLGLALDVGERPLALAPRGVHQGGQLVAPDCAPLFLPDGVRESMPAWLTPSGPWGQLPRRQPTGSAPKPRWRPLPQLL